MRARKSPAPSRNVLAFDPGYANLGWAVARVAGGRVTPVALGLIATAKDDEVGWSRVVGKAGGARAQEKRRVIELATAVHLLVDHFAPVEILAEGYSPVRDSSTTGHMAMVWSVLFLEALHRGIPFRDLTPQELKVKLCGDRSADKNAVADALGREYGEELLRALLVADGVKWGDRGHPFDALGVATVLALL